MACFLEVLFIQGMPTRALGSCCGLPCAVDPPAAALRLFPHLVQTLRPALRGRSPSRPAILEGLFLSVWVPHVLATERSLGVLVYPVVISASSPWAEPHRKGRVRNVLQVPSGKAANVALPPPPLPSPRGWPPCFLNTKWRHVAWIRRREIGVSTKALECAQPSPPTPVRRWGTSCLASLLTTWLKPSTGGSKP